MKVNENFSARRLWLLIRGDAIGGYRSVLMISAALAGAILLTAIITRDEFDPNKDFYLSWFGGMLFIWGLVASSQAFRQLHDKTRNESYLLVPASALEKTVARLLSVTVGIAGFLTVFTFAVSVIVEASSLLFFDWRIAFFNPFDPLVWKCIAIYIPFQSLFFLGAAWFRRAHFIKTVLAVTLALMGLMVFLLILVRVIYASDWVTLYFLLVPELLYRSNTVLLETVLVGGLVLLPPVCWCIAWLRVKEAQVSDGV